MQRNCAQARSFAARLAEAGYTLLNEVVLNQLLAAFGDAGRSAAEGADRASRR